MSTNIAKAAFGKAAKTGKVLGVAAASAWFYVASTTYALAGGGIGSVLSSDDSGNTSGVVNTVVDVAFACGLFMVIYGLLHAFKALKTDGRDAKMTSALAYVLVGVLLTIPSWVLGVGVSTLFSSGGEAAQGVVAIPVQ